MTQFKTVPYAHQLKALDLSADKQEFGFLMEMGTGKSKVAIDDAARLWRAGEIMGMFIVSNKGSYRNWCTKEIPVHLPDDIPRTVRYWDGRIRYEGPPTFSPESQSMDIFVMNVEALAFPKAYKEASDFLRACKSVFILDEASKIKNPKALRTKAAQALGKLAKYRRIMTGSPITKNPLDLFAQCQFLRPGILGFTSYFSFRAHYANLFQMDAGNRSFKVVKGYKNLEELSSKLAGFTYRVTKDECLDLPPKTFNTLDVELTPEQRGLYKQLKEEAMAEFGNGAVTFAPLAITRILRLHQMICGHLPDQDGTLHEIPSNRVKVVMDWLEETSGKVTIWACFIQDILALEKAIAAAYGAESVVTYYGATKNRAEVIDSFENGEVRFFIGMPKVGGYGNTMVSSNTVLYYSYDDDLDSHSQSQERTHRIGQKRAVSYTYVMARGTVDEKIAKANREKRQLAAEILGDKFKEWI